MTAHPFGLYNQHFSFRPFKKQALYLLLQFSNTSTHFPKGDKNRQTSMAPKYHLKFGS